jgi:hypothetical protein
MLKGYEILQGIIHQKVHSPFQYTQAYVAKYEKYLFRELGRLRVEWIKSMLGHLPDRVLDFGAGIGAFLEQYHASSNAAVYAYDIIDYPLPKIITKVVDPTLNEYRLVTFYDSLEHLETLDIIGKIKCQFLCVSVPWCHNISDEWLRSWKHLKPDEHLWHFDPTSLTSMCRRFGFDLIAFSNPEDEIRKSSDKLPNILTAIFRKE